MRYLTIILCVFFSSLIHAQEFGFKFGHVSISDLSAKVYDLDTTANAIVLDEFGYAVINIDEGKLILERHLKIKILKQAGFDEANFQIYLYTGGGEKEAVRNITASTFNLEGAAIRESKMDAKNIFTDRNPKYDLIKFTLPDIRVGSVLDVLYTIESPYIFNFKPWEFQAEIPKLRSEYWAQIPANYDYNITVKGPFPLSKNETSVIRECFTYGSIKSDCALYKLAMINILSFKEEKYMTAKSNFLSCINFELSEIKYFDGRVKRFTNEWKDVDEELERHKDFGLQIKKGRNLWENQIHELMAGESDPLSQAKIIYRFVTSQFRWDGKMGKYSEKGAKNTFDSKTGNVGDINLLLVAALQAAKLNANPVILSTRENGLPIQIHPVMTDFNYVVAQVDINNEKYLLDATINYFPFGLLPERCLNGQGRLIGKESGWVDLKPPGKQKEITVLNLMIDSAGVFQGTMVIRHSGYDAANKRLEISEFKERKAYIAKLENGWSSIAIKKYEVQDLENFELPLVEKMEVSIAGFDNLDASKLYLNPFLTGKISKNPFKSDERFYPVDFGISTETTLVMSLSYPATFNLEEQPKNAVLALPHGGGRFLFSVGNLSNRITVNSALSLNKTVYPPEDYHALKEFYNRIIQTHDSMLVFSKK